MTRIDTGITTNPIGSVTRTSTIEDLSGTAHTVWTQDTAPSHVYYSKRPRGGAWTAPEQVDGLVTVTDVVTDPCIAIDGAGTLVCLFLWAVSGVGNSNWYTRRKVSGGSWGGQLQWTTRAAGDYAPTKGALVKSQNGDIWMAFDDEDSGNNNRPRLRLYRMNSGADASSSGSYTNIRNYEDATYMPGISVGKLNLSAISRSDYLISWEGLYTVPSPDKIYLFADWVIDGRSPAVYSGTMRAALIDTHDVTSIPAYDSFDASVALSPDGRIGICVDAHSFHWDLSNADFRLRTFYLKNNTWGTVKYGPDSQASSILRGSLQFAGLTGRAYVIWEAQD
jgi:hypothetical protein